MSVFLDREYDFEIPGRPMGIGETAIPDLPELPPFDYAEFENVTFDKLPHYYCGVENFNEPAYVAFEEYLKSLKETVRPEVFDVIERAIHNLAFPRTKGTGQLQEIPTIKEVGKMSSAKLRGLDLTDTQIKVLRMIFPRLSAQDSTAFEPIQ